MDKRASPDPASKEYKDYGSLEKKMVQTLKSNGWQECKFENLDTYRRFTFSKDGKLLEVYKGGSNGVDMVLTVSIATSEVPDPSPKTASRSVSVTREWKTYENQLFGFQISYPPDWSIIWLHEGTGSSPALNYCESSHCLRMLLGRDQKGEVGDSIGIEIAPPTILPDASSFDESTYHIGKYRTSEQRENYSYDTPCGRVSELSTDVGEYRYAFELDQTGDSFQLKDVFVRVLSTVKIAPVPDVK